MKDLVVKISADIAEFKRGMNDLTRSGQETAGLIGKAFVGASAALAGGAMFKEMIDATKNVAGEVQTLSRSLGITAEEASVLRIALDDTFLTAEDMTGAASRMTKQLAKNEEAFTNLGVATRDGNGHFRSTVDIMTDVNTKLLTFKEGTDRNVEGIKIYGKGWDEARKMLKLTSEAMTDAKSRAEELHLIFGDSGLKAVKEYKLAMKDLEDVSESFKVQVGTALIPVLTRLAVSFGDIGASAANSTGNNLKESLRFWRDFHAEVAYILRDIAIKANGGSFGERWITPGGRKELAAELEASKQLYDWQMMKNAEMFGDSVNPRKDRPSADGRSMGGDSARSKIDDAAKKAAQERYQELSDIYQLELQDQQKRYQEMSDIYQLELQDQINAAKKAEEEKTALYQEAADKYELILQDQARSRKQFEEYKGIMEAGDPIAQLDNRRAEQLARIAEWDEKELGMAEKKAAAMAKIDKDYYDAKAKVQNQSLEASANSLYSSMSQISSMLMQGNKKQFEQGKKMAELLIGIDTARAASAAFAGAAAAGGPWGVALGVAAGIAALAVGAMNMARLDAIQYEARAMGGPVTGGTTYLVGERGPELFTPGASGQITSNDKLARLGGNSISVTPVFQISTGVSDTVRAEVMRLAPTLTNMSVSAVYQAINSGGNLSAAVGRM